MRRLRRQGRRGKGLSPFAAGLIGILVVAAVAYAAFVKTIPFVTGQGYEVKGVFSSAGNQLQPNAPVRIAGVEAGKVEKVETGPGGTALVTMKLKESALPLHRDAEAQIRPRLFLEGNYYVAIRPGSPSAPSLDSDSTIPLTRTSTSVALGELLSTLNSDSRRSFRRVLKEYGGALDKGGAESFNRALLPASGAFRGLATTMEDLRGQRERDLSGFIANQARVSGAFADRREQLADLVTNLNVTMGALAERRGATAATISGFARTLSTARPALADVNATLPALRRFAVDVRPALRRAPATLDAAVPFLDELDRLVAPRALRGLTQDLRPTLRQVTALQPRLGRLGQQVDPVASCLRDVIVPTLKRQVPDGALTQNMPVWQEARGFSGTTSASQNFDANGHDLRLHVGGGDATVSPLVGFPTPAFSLGENPVLGSSPRFQQGTVPPFRPDVACSTQQPSDLNGGSQTASTSSSRSGRTVDPKGFAELGETLQRSQRAAQRGDQAKADELIESLLPPQRDAP